VIARAFRWRPETPCGLDDLVRELPGGGLALANGYETGFSICWATGSRLLLDLFVAAWREDPSTAFEKARWAFPPLAAPLITDPDDTMGDPAASLLVAAIAASSVELTWIGDGGAIVARAGAVLARSTPHTLPVHHARVLLRVISAQQADEPPGRITVPVRAGDTVVVASGAVLAAVAPDEIARLAATCDPQALADELVARAFAGKPPAFAAVGVTTV
jgi:hypothetical protein